MAAPVHPRLARPWTREHQQIPAAIIARAENQAPVVRPGARRQRTHPLLRRALQVVEVRVVVENLLVVFDPRRVQRERLPHPLARRQLLESAVRKTRSRVAAREQIGPVSRRKPRSVLRLERLELRRRHPGAADCVSADGAQRTKFPPQALDVSRHRVGTSVTRQRQLVFRDHVVSFRRTAVSATYSTA